MPHPELTQTSYIADWSKTVAIQLSAKENLQLSEAHWPILRLMRDFYHQRKLVPNNRVLVNLLRERSPNTLSSSELRQLFDPADPAAQAARIAGLPAKPCLSPTSILLDKV